MGCSTMTVFPFTVIILVLLGKLNGRTRGSCSQFHGSDSSSVGAKDEGRAGDVSPPLQSPGPASQPRPRAF